MRFLTMRNELPELGKIEKYDNHGEHCSIQRSEPLMIIRPNFSPIIGCFACYTWTDDEGFSEPSYCYETSDNPMDIVDVFYDDVWVYLDEMENFVNARASQSKSTASPAPVFVKETPPPSTGYADADHHASYEDLPEEDLENDGK